MRILTLAQLRSAGACPPQVALFEKLFGDRVEVTEEVCRAHATEFQWYWAGCFLLPPGPVFEEFYDKLAHNGTPNFHESRAAAFARAYNSLPPCP